MMSVAKLQLRVVLSYLGCVVSCLLAGDVLFRVASCVCICLFCCGVLLHACCFLLCRFVMGCSFAFLFLIR